MKRKKKISVKFLKSAKIKKNIIKIIYIVICTLILFHITILLNTTIKKQDYFSLFGISIITADNSMMSPKINKNDLIIANSSQNIVEGDIICYYSKGKLEVSEVINKIQQDGKIKYVTKFINTYYPNLEEITEQQIIGKVRNNIPILGVIFNILKSKITTVILIFALMLKFSYNKYMYKQLRKRRGKKFYMNDKKI